jgi:hypothetical protein
VVFWNVQNLFEVGANTRAPQSPAELNAKLGAITRVLVRTGPPAILALAEVATLRLANEIAARVYRQPAPVPLAMELAPYPSAQTGLVVMGDPNLVSAIAPVAADRGTGAGRPRAFAVDVTTARRPAPTDRLRLIACHWKSELRYGGVLPADDRAASGRWLDAHVSPLGSTAPVLALGDMNTEPYAPEVTRSLRAARHYSSVQRGRLYNAMWSWLAEPDAYLGTRVRGYTVSRVRTSFAGSPSRIIDHLLASRGLLRGGPFRLDQGSVRLFADASTAVTRRTGHMEPATWTWDAATGTGSGTSDHFPLVTDLLY